MSMFRRRQKLSMALSHEVFMTEQVTNADGAIESRLVSAASSLPDAAMFDLKAQLDAGIDQEEVKSTVLSPQSVNADTVVRKYTKKSQVKNEGE